ncbi:MAG: protein kinase [Gammaproteobacteria bacterium]
MAALAAGVEFGGRYHLLRQLGRGGSAEVWAATDGATRTEVALRVLATANEHAAVELLAQLQAETDRLRGLVHPGILRPLAVVRDGLHCAVAFECADSGDLGQLRGASHQVVLTAISEIVDILHYVHAQGLVHGDLKTANVLRDSTGRWRLTDFRSIGALAASRAVSLSTVSPAQLDGATPAAADDLYSLGALTFDLLAGHPPLHPGITPERIRTEVPVLPRVDGQGQIIPVALAQLVAALLQKEPERRPASMGAVRALLAEIHRVAPTVATTRESAVLPPVRAKAEKQGLPIGVIGGLLVLVVAVLAVVFWLPRFVAERGPLIAATIPASPATTAEVVQPPVDQTPPPSVASRSQADAALADRLKAEDAAKAAAADRWGGADWLEAQRVAEQGDARYRAENFDGAVASFKEASERFNALASGAPAAYAAAMKSGEDALRDADQPAAVSAFERALLIRPGDAAAQANLKRSQQLHDVLRMMADAAGQEAAGDLTTARKGYARVLALDAQWTPAREAVAHIDAVRATAEFEQAMATALSAMADGRTNVARQSLNRALALRPGDPAARTALDQLAVEDRDRRLTVLQANAEKLAASEQWSAAADEYRAMLKIDPSVAAAQSGLKIADTRAMLDKELEAALTKSDRFNDPQVAAAASATVRVADQVDSPGSRLSGQLSELRQRLAEAATPVKVELTSDGLTNVEIYKVGKLGAFASRSVELRPGRYVIVGRRDGYRDVRLEVLIKAGGKQEPIFVRCEEAI